MRIAMYSREPKEADLPIIREFISALEKLHIEFLIEDNFYHKIRSAIPFPVEPNRFSSYADLCASRPDVLVTLGGDGTILSAVTLIRDSQIPIMGINLGRMGFLASIEKKQILHALQCLEAGQYHIDERMLLQLESNPSLFGETPFALNDFSILKRDSSSMVNIHVYLNGAYLNTYWSDGLIISTPTGSTGYSLSCGGPIVFPHADSLIITPVAPHNLNVRPAVISDKHVISFEVEGRTDQFLCTLDSRFETFPAHQQLAVRRCDFTIRLLHLQEYSFMETLRFKLNWGQDQRNL